MADDVEYGEVPTAAQWNSFFAAKQDALGYTPLNRAGDTMLGRLTLQPSSAPSAGLNVGVGVAPISPNNGDVWLSMGGLFYQIGGVTYGPVLTGSAGASFAATPPLGVSFPSGVVTYSISTSVSTTQYAAVKIDGTTITVNGSNQLQAVGGTATNVAIGTTTITMGSTDRLLFDDAGIVGELIVGTGLNIVGSTLINNTVTANSGQFIGTNTNDSATAGNIGEYEHAELAAGSAASLSASPINLITLSLTAGDWDVWGVMVLNGVSGTGTLADVAASISTTSITHPSIGVTDRDDWASSGVIANNLGNNVITLRPGPARISLASTANVYLVASMTTLGSANASGYGQIRARRAR